jgi:hypothetical protein
LRLEVAMSKRVAVQIGDQLFEREDGSAFGAVLAVHPHTLLVDIEGHGQVVLAAAVVKSVHDGKLLIDVKQLAPELQETIAHAHDRETEYK